MAVTIFRSKPFRKTAEPQQKTDNPPVSEEPDRVYQIDPLCIHPNPAQPRRTFDDETIAALAESIGRYGILQPLTVRRGKEGYELIAGERRLRAALLLELPRVPCLIRDVDCTESAELALIENLQREDLNLFEEAMAMAALIDLYGLTQEEVARQLAVSQSCVANKLRLLRLSAEEQQIILQNKLTERHARALIRIKDADQRGKVLAHVVAKGLHVAATEELVERMLAQQQDAKAVRRRAYSGAMKDVRLFYNSVGKAVDLMRRSGIDAVEEREENDHEIKLTVTIRKKGEKSLADTPKSAAASSKQEIR